MYKSNPLWCCSACHLLETFVTVQGKDNLKQQLLIESSFIISAPKDLDLAISISIKGSSITLFSREMLSVKLLCLSYKKKTKPRYNTSCRS